MEHGKFDKFLQDNKPQTPVRNWFLYIGIAIAAVIIFIVIIIALWPNGSEPKTTPEATSQGEIDSTSEAVPSLTKTHTTTPSPTLTDTATVTLTPTLTPTNTPSPTTTPSATPTLTATPTPNAASTPNLITAICTCEFGNAALYKEPDSASEQVGVYVEVDNEVIVLGRAVTGSWIYVEFEGAQGWVDARRFNISVPFEQLEIAATPFPTWTPTSSTPGATSATNGPAVTSNPPSVAYWQETSSSSIGDGRWKVILAIRVPPGSNYSFSIADLIVTKQFIGIGEDGYDHYNVTISGMSCDGPLTGDLIIKRDGQQLEIRNEHTQQSGAIFVNDPGC